MTNNQVPFGLPVQAAVLQTVERWQFQTNQNVKELVRAVVCCNVAEEEEGVVMYHTV